MKKTKAHKLSWKILHTAFALGPIAAGADKYLKLIADWPQYLSPQIAKLIPVSAEQLMQVVGGLEIFAGLLVWWKPRIGAFMIGGWLTLIVMNLLIGGFYAAAFRDTLIAIAAYSFAMMTTKR